MSRRTAVAVAAGAAGAAALVALYLGVVTWAQGPDHAAQLLWDDRLFVGLVSAGFGTQVGLFAYLRLLQRALSRDALAVAGAGTATSSVSMIACCAHHLTDLLPVVGVSGLAVFLVEFRTPLMLLGLATNAFGAALMLLQVRRLRAGYRIVPPRGAVAA